MDLNGINAVDDSLENAKHSILIIERFMMALSKMTVPLQVAEEAIGGIKFLQAMHVKLLQDIGPDEVERMKKEFGPAPTTPPSKPSADSAII